MGDLIWEVAGIQVVAASPTGHAPGHTVDPMPDRFLVTREPTVTLTHTLATAATDSSGVLLRSFAIALVIMAPIALWQARRIRERRRRQRSDSYQQATDLSSLSSGTTDTKGATLESLVAEINRAAATLESSQTTELTVPGELTIGGSRADPQLVEVVLRDALDRSGLDVTATTNNGDSIQLECRRR